MALLPELNENKTRENARELLKSYAPMKRRISYGDSVYDLTQAIQYTDMPKHQSSMNGQEHKTAMMFSFISKDSLNYTKKLGEIDRAINQLSEIHKRILRLSYCERENYSINAIAAKIEGYRVNDSGEYETFYYSTKSIEKLKAAALLQFAEAYKDGELLCFEK